MSSAQSKKVRVFLDVDGTLYRYGDTNFHLQFQANMSRVVPAMLPHIKDREEAKRLHDLYHHTYGNPLVGIMKHHCIHDGQNTCTDGDASPLRPMPSPEELQQYFSDFITVDYNVIQPNNDVKAMLEAMMAIDGHDLWLFTNANQQHAKSCTQGLGIQHLFMGNEPASPRDSDKTYFKCIDAFDQWANSDSINTLGNKPFAVGFEAADKKAESHPCYKMGCGGNCGATSSATSVDDNSFIRVMVEDALVNLDAPNKMGWITVWIADGRTIPVDGELSRIKPTIVIERIEDLREALCKKLSEMEKLF